MRWPTILALTLAAAPAVVPGVAAAQSPPPAPKPVAGRMSIDLDGGLSTRRYRYYMRGQRVRVNGVVRPFVPGQAAELLVVRKGHVVSSQRVPIRKGRGTRGRFTLRFLTRRQGTLRLVVRHVATPQQAAFRARDKRIKVVRLRAGAGSRGSKVLLLQRGLRSLGFAVPVTGRFDGGTARAVTAFRKTNGMGTSGFASTAIYDKVLRRRGAFRLKHPRAGRHVEFDWSRQLLVLAARGRAWRVYHASSGKPSTPTVFGAFRFYLKTPGYNSHAMYFSNYFIRGYAVHGYAGVPNYPASHGCIRVPIPNAVAIYRHISIGERIATTQWRHLFIGGRIFVYG